MFHKVNVLLDYNDLVIKTHGSESRGQGGSNLAKASRRTHVSILQEQTLLK